MVNTGAEKKKTVAPRRDNTNLSGGSTIAPAMVNKDFRKLEVRLHVVIYHVYTCASSSESNIDFSLH